VYRYKAARAHGEVVEGTLHGTGRAEAVAALQAQGLIPIRVEEGGGTPAVPAGRIRLFRRRDGISHPQVVVLTRELATLLGAGLPLYQALTTLMSLAEEPELVEVLGRVRSGVQQGASLADALEAQGGAFSGLYVSLVRAGEAGGALHSVLVGLADYLERSKEVRDGVVSALIYPAILLVAALVSVLLLLGYVVPQFTELFEGVGQTLPLATRVTIAVGNVVQHYGWALVIGLVALAAGVRRALANPRIRLRWDAQLLRLPVVSDLVRKIEVARFARTLGALLGNGVPVLKAMGIARGTVGNRIIGRAVENVTRRIREGSNLSGPLAQEECFPAFAVHMIRIGEESGGLSAMLLKVAEVYERDSAVAIKRALTLLEPVLILVLGAIIAAIIMSILVAVLGINQLVA
jgi:general secretion pathway protein F